MQRTQATHWPRVLILWLCGIFAAMQFAKISFAFLALQQVFATTPAIMGLVLSTVGMVGLVFGVTMGVFAPAIAYRRLLLGGLALGAVVSAVQSLMPSLPLFWATRVLEGASHLAVVVAAPTLIAASSGPRHRSIAMGLWSTFVGVAFALTSALG
ncbi:MAG: MFS transporter, partial [Burkholderiales bacterium PBB4]